MPPSHASIGAMLPSGGFELGPRFSHAARSPPM
jgi:hypothetical protein